MSAGARRLDGPVARGASFEFTVDGERVTAYAGETVATALLVHGRRHQRVTSRRAEPRGLFCGMGVCFDCLAEIDGVPNRQACMVPVAPGMRIARQHGARAARA